MDFVNNADTYKREEREGTILVGRSSSPNKDIASLAKGEALSLVTEISSMTREVTENECGGSFSVSPPLLPNPAAPGGGRTGRDWRLLPSNERRIWIDGKGRRCSSPQPSSLWLSL